MTSTIRSAIVLGAGIAGLSCATELARAGITVTLLDKGRRPGGRVATRRMDGVSFNHGAQFATARGEEFGALLTELRTNGQAAVWPAAGGGHPRIVFLPCMSALPAVLAARATDLGVTILTERQAVFLHQAGPSWTVRHMNAVETTPGTTAASGGLVSPPHDAVLLAMPASQAKALLTTPGHRFAEMADKAVIAPCWAVTARFSDRVACGDVLQPLANPIAWAARESSRPGATSDEEAWTLHATASWSRTRLEDPPDGAAAALIAAFRFLTGAPAPVSARGHRWRHALVETALGEPCLWDAAAQIGACGDWCLGGRVEAAYDSGLSLARALLNGTTIPPSASPR